jgi:hypothetical protein
MPRGPSDVRAISAIVLAAVILFFCAWLPFVSEVPSFNRTIGTCCADIVATYVSNKLCVTGYFNFILYYLPHHAFHIQQSIGMVNADREYFKKMAAVTWQSRTSLLLYGNALSLSTSGNSRISSGSFRRNLCRILQLLFVFRMTCTAFPYAPPCSRYVSNQYLSITSDRFRHSLFAKNALAA